MAKAARWPAPDAQTRKLGERTGLETPVVLAVNDVYWVLGGKTLGAEANALSTPPGEYDRKVKTQRN